MRQKQLIQLWNAAEAYIKQVRQAEARSDSSTHTAQQKQSHEARLARESRKAQGGV